MPQLIRMGQPKRSRITNPLKLREALQEKRGIKSALKRIKAENRGSKKYRNVPHHVYIENEKRYREWQSTLTPEIVEQMGEKEFFRMFKSFLPMRRY